MSANTVLDFRKAVNDNPAWQNEIRELADQGTFDPIKFAREHGFAISADDLSKALTQLSGKLTPMEIDLMARQQRSSARLRDLDIKGDVRGGQASNSDTEFGIPRPKPAPGPSYA